MVEEQDNTGALQASYVYGRYIDEPIQMTRGENTTVYYHGDDQYNVTALTNTDGNVVERYRYDDFGAPHVYSGTGAPLTASTYGNPYLFTGRAYDSDLGLYDYRSRHMHPGLGRFTTRDQIGLWGDPANMGNPYTYVGNAPGMCVDPFGFEGFLTEAGKVIGIYNPSEYFNYYILGRTVDGRPLVDDAPASTAAPEPYGELPAGIRASDLGPGLHAKMKEGAQEGLDEVQRYVAAGSFLAGPLPGMAIDAGNGLFSGARGNTGDMLANFGGVLFAGISATGKLGKGGASACDAAAGDVRSGHTANKIIVGTPHGSEPHKLLTNSEAITMAESGEYTKVFVNRALSTITGGEVRSLKRPDVAGVRLDGTVDLTEVVSKSQTEKEMRVKIDIMQKILGSQAGPNGKVMK